MEKIPPNKTILHQCFSYICLTKPKISSNITPRIPPTLRLCNE